MDRVHNTWTSSLNDSLRPHPIIPNKTPSLNDDIGRTSKVDHELTQRTSKNSQERLNSLRPRPLKNSAPTTTRTQQPYQQGVTYPIRKHFYQSTDQAHEPHSYSIHQPISLTGSENKGSLQSTESGRTPGLKSNSTGPTNLIEATYSRGPNSPGDTEEPQVSLANQVAPPPRPLSPKYQQPSPQPLTSTRPNLRIQTSSLETTQHNHTPRHRTLIPPFPILKKQRASPYPLPYPPIIEYQAHRELIREGQYLVQEQQLIKTAIEQLKQKEQTIKTKIDWLCQETKDPRSRIRLHLRDTTGRLPTNSSMNAD